MLDEPTTTCNCIARLDCERSNGNPKGGLPTGIPNEFRYSDGSTRHYNPYTAAWLVRHATRYPA